MRINSLKAIGKAAARGAAVLLFGAGLAGAQTTVSLTAAPATASLPDGSGVPMWGYTCGATTGGSCSALNPAATTGVWSPVVIKVPYTGPSTSLSITLTNSLPAPVPTSLTIVGQLGGGLGAGTKAPSPTHNPQGATWPIAGTPGGDNPTFTPPAQADRVQSFGTEVANGATTSTPLTWNALRPGTYLLESGTHPSIQGSMGLYGIVVVTTAPAGSVAGTAYPGVAYKADVPLLFGEIDPVQNAAVYKAVHTTGFSETAVWSGLPGGCGNPATANSGNCYPPVVNYSPLYYTINGVAFDKTHTASSLFPSTPATGVTGDVLVRMVNAGLRMHVPTIVGAQPSSLSTAAAGTGGFTLVAEDGNKLPGVPRIQSEVFMAAGKTYDVMITAPTAGSALPVFDRQLSLSGNAIARDSGMLAYIGVNGAAVPLSNATSKANTDTYNAVIAGKTLTISDPSKGVIANDQNIYGVKLVSPAGKGTVTLNPDGTFTYVANANWNTNDHFWYCGNGATYNAANPGPNCAVVTMNPETIESASGISCSAGAFASKLAKSLKINAPGVLSGCTDAKGFPLTVNPASVTPASGLTLSVDANGAFKASVPSAGTYTFSFKAQNSQGTVASAATTVTLTFPTGSNLNVTVLDGNDKKTTISDYRWIIEEDRTYYVDPKCTQNPLPAGCTPSNFNFGTSFHTSFMPLVATGCTGDSSCGANQTVLGVAAPLATPSFPGDVALDPTKRYYISVLPGDAAQPFINGYTGAPDCSAAGVSAGSCGHGMGGAPIPLVAGGTHNGQAVTILTEPSPYPPATLSVFVFEDDYPLNGEHDAGGQLVDTSAAGDEPGLGGFQITLQDNAGGTGDATGTPTYDMFNMPLSNALSGTIDPSTGKDACPISAQDTTDGQNGVAGMIVTCPEWESDGVTFSPLAGQAIVKNLYPGRYGITANEGASRIAAGEEWLQTNTLDGQKAHDSFMRIGEPGYFQEFGPAGYHVTIGFANPKVINDRLAQICASSTADCTHEVKGHVTTGRMSRTPDERLYGSGTHDAYGFTQCYISMGDPDGADFAFQKCADDGSFDFKGVPAGNWKITTFDQWNDQVVDGITTAVGLCDPSWTTFATTPPTGCIPTLDMGEIAVHQWQANIYTRTFLDTDYSGVSPVDQDGNPTKPGLPLVDTNIRFRDGSYSNFNSTDLNGFAGFNEVFPLFNWYVIETDSTRYKNTGTHVVYDSGGPDDNTSPGGSPCFGATGAARPCGNSSIAANFANTYEPNPLPSDLSVPGAAYCAEGADCASTSISGGAKPSDVTNHSTGRIDPAWVDSYGWQGFSGQNNFLEFGKKPFAVGENGGIHGHVIYASTRPFDDPQLLLQLSWEPMIPHVKVNLYKEGLAADGLTQTLVLVDTTQTSSFDDWAQGVRSDGVPNMNCPGQGTDTSTLADPYFWFALKDQPQWLDLYNNGGAATQTVSHHSQFKCYDGMHNWNQLQPAPYDGMFKFPSITGMDPASGKPTATNCTTCVTNPDSSDPYRYGGSATPVAWTPGHGTPMLPDGKYVVEVVVPPGYELVKEEDKNILIGDNFIAPVTQQFGGLGSIFILPDQAEVSSTFNANNPNNSTSNLGRNPNLPSHEADTGTVETYWPCVGTPRIVPDFISLFPGSAEVAPFAGEKRNLCDRKEVTLTDQTAALTKFYLFTETHAASHFTGQITDDFSAEFDPYSPAFGEKFAPAYVPVSIKDWAGNEISRVYADAWGVYNGLNYSTWEVNPPNPTGYGPTMMVTCMNDPGPIPDPAHPGQTMTDPLYQSGYSDFCYELPFMPSQTGYFDTPVVPTSAFAGGYNTADCSYPDATPAISEVDGDGVGPWVSAASKALTINSLGDQQVDNYGYSGPSANAAPYNQQRITRHYGFGTQCTAPTTGNATCNTLSSVTIGGAAATITSWSDTQIKVIVPSGTPACSVQQQAIYGGSAAKCGELVVTAGNGKQSIDTVTVTAGGKAPTRLAAGQTIQSAIDAAKPGDLIIVPPGSYTEMLLMWKPVRLQGVGAATTFVDANPHPAGRLNPWRRQVVCTFGLALNGTPSTGNVSLNPDGTVVAGSGGANPYDPSGTYTCTPDQQFSVDRLPLEATVGWDATLNGNLAEQLIEPTIMGAFEGAGITVLGKGVEFPNGSTPFASDVFPTGTRLLTSGDCLKNGANPFPSNFFCNPSSIDGLTVKNSSQGGGGIMVHGWAHNIQIANNRVLNNQGTLSGGITIGQGEHPDAYLVGLGDANTVPSSCISENGLPNNLAMPYCFNLDVNLHNNYVVQNSSLGDELFSSTPAGAGGVTFCSGSDYYKFNYNWICGNMSTGDGAGFAHLGFSYDGDIEHNTILFNQSTNPTIATNGGGLLVMGAPDQDPTCPQPQDVDCVVNPATILPSDGTGPGLVINANLIVGNSADAGSGGGLRLQAINGNDVLMFPNGATVPTGNNKLATIPGHPAHSATQAKTHWNAIQVTNNIIANNVAGWDGGGVSMLDALAVDVVNNTIVSNNSTASSGVLLQTLFAPLASTQGTNCVSNSGSQSCPQVAGLVSVTNSAVLKANIQLPSTGTVTCPTGHGTNHSCINYSVPVLANNILWKNRSFLIGVGGLDTGFQAQQNKVTIFNSGFGGTGSALTLNPTAVANQGSTGACDDTHASYWDIGVRGDAGPSNHGSGYTLTSSYSIMTNNGGLAETTDTTTNILAPVTVLGKLYCNGSRIPVEAFVAAGAYGWQVPPGTNESNALPAPPFTLSAAAVVDEGNNWINLRWGPLSLVSPATNATLGDFTLSGTVAVQKVPANEAVYSQDIAVLQNDFFGNARPAVNNINHLDIGAIESLTAAAPAFDLAAGTYHNVPPPTLHLSTTTPGATIYYTYTTNGLSPTVGNSTVYNPATGITINKTGTVEAFATAPGYANSPVSAKAYIYTVPVPAPSFGLAGGNYTTPHTLFLTDAIPGCVTNCGLTIYYTYSTNPTVPTNNSTPYNAVTGITIDHAGTVEAIAYPTDTATYFTSPVSNKQYTYTATLTAPTVTPATGIFATGANRTVTMTDPANSALAGFAIYYTTDGSTPGTSAGGSTSLYAGTFNLNVANPSTVTVKALATATGFPASAVTTRTYTFESQLAAPNFLLSNVGSLLSGAKLTFGTYAQPGVIIYYTTNGSAPTTASNVYDPAAGVILNILPTEFVRAIAVAPGYITSNPSAKLYNLH